MYKRFIKRVLDIMMAVMGLPLLLLAFVMIGPMIYLEDRGPIFYNAPRLGKDGRIFTMYKFRSMKVNSPDIRNEDGSTFSSEDDPRLTRIGRFIRKTSIDELPQLLNVLKGDMSIVGPRPPVPGSNPVRLNGRAGKRYEVRPGITGYAQAFFRNSISQAEKFAYDTEYVENLSFLLDVRILVATFATVALRRDVFTNVTSSRREI
jgi:undecaprenyl phosphate N,N'-diacetylbacillosamine 1-phosphate transferase